MLDSWNRIGVRRRRFAAALACVAAGWLVLSQPCAFAQGAPPQSISPQSIEAQPVPPPVSPVAPEPPSAPVSKPGFFESVGRWFDQGTSKFREHLQGAKRRMDNIGDDAAASSRQITDQAAKVGKGAADVGKSAADATINAVDAVAKLSGARVVQGRERCVTAPNGAPDCLSAATELCRKSGYNSGKSMDFTSAEECPVGTLLSQSRAECTTVTFINRAMCQ
jgi:hypothetical protein